MTLEHTVPDLTSLIREFYPSVESLGQLHSLAARRIPDPYRWLLDHDEHMTVRVESFHGEPVGVRVLQATEHDTHYAREILLTRLSDQAVVQYGIVRLNLAYLDAEVTDEIRAKEKPLGRILIAHDVMRKVELTCLWSVTPGEILVEHLGSKPTYGRTAMIYCNSEPAIELLEIVAPVTAG